LGAPLSASSIRKLAAPFKQPESGMVTVLGSCNGLVCVAQLHIAPHIWNPSTGLLHKLPDPGPEISCMQCSGFGYLTATDDYKVMVSTASLDRLEVEIFSLRARVWKRIQDPLLLLRRCCIENAEECLLNEALQWFKDGSSGLLLNEALHWLDNGGCNDAGIVTPDLAVEEFRKMPLPNVMSDEIRRIYMCVSLEEASVCFIVPWLMFLV
jgi:F-box interacting protein